MTDHIDRDTVALARLIDRQVSSLADWHRFQARDAKPPVCVRDIRRNLVRLATRLNKAERGAS